MKEKNNLQEKMQTVLFPILRCLKWVLLAVLLGTVIGAASSVFALGLQKVTDLRVQHGQIVLALPLLGLIIAFFYKKCLGEDGGTNLVLADIHAREQVPAIMAPLIAVSTLLTHLGGGSAGREGAALQLGGSLGNTLAKLFRLDAEDSRVAVMCGMSAAFAAVFGTPTAAAVFSLEVASVGIMYYTALLPCVLSALIGSRFSAGMGISPENFHITDIPAFDLLPALKILLLAALCAGVSALLCKVLHAGGHLSKKYIRDPYLRIAAGGILLAAVTLIRGNQDFAGASVGLIERAMEGETEWYFFLLKMVLTAVTIGCGYKGGEIVPTFCVGATFGCMMGQLLGLSPSLCAACGMTALFCGATNCPISSLLISFEMFGYGAMPYFLISVAVSYYLSGYYGLYKEQTIVYSKYKTKYINRKTAE